MRGRPLVLAIQDSHAPSAKEECRNALPIYLYGMDWEANGDNGEFIPTKLRRHIWGKKNIPSGFFRLPNSQHISAVMYNQEADLQKFERIGICAGFGLGNEKLRKPSFPRKIRQSETWVEGMEIFHNPSALMPLSVYLFPGATHWRISPEGNLEYLPPTPLHDLTQII